MKKNVRNIAFLAVAVLVLLLFGCALGLPGHGGSIGLAFAPGMKASQEVDWTVFIYLYQGNRLFRGPHRANLDDSGYGSVKLSGIPPGKNYSLIILQRKVEEPGTEKESFFYSFASTKESINVRAGTETQVSIPITDFENGSLAYHRVGFEVDDGEPLVFDLPVKSVAALSEDEGYIYAVAAETLFEGIFPGDPEVVIELAETEAEFPAVNSLSVGVLPEGDSMLANTVGGLYAAPDWTLIYPTEESPVDVRKSASYADFYVLKTSTSLIGKKHDSDGEDPTWTVANLGTDCQVADMFVYNGGDPYSSVYLATNFGGVFVLSEEFFHLDFSGKEPADYLLNPSRIGELNPVGEVYFPFPKGTPPVLCFGRHREADHLYIGTSGGLYFAECIDGEGLTTPMLPVGGTEGLRIDKILTDSSGAAILISGPEVIIYNPLSDNPRFSLIRFPFFSEMVGKVNDVGYYQSDDTDYILVAGEKGLIAVNMK